MQKSTAMTLVLVILRDGSRHGYDIAREVERRSDSTLSFNHGTLYPVLHSLERAGLVSSSWEHPKGERKRRIYALTDAGIGEAERAIASWRDFSAAMERVIQGRGGEQPA